MSVTLPKEVSTVVIGGGVVGSSMLYHLTSLGLNETILLESNELSSGTTWGSSALLTYFVGNQTFARLHKETLDLYKSLEDETGQSCGYHQTGSIRLAESSDRMKEYSIWKGILEYLNLPCKLIGRQEIVELHPFINVEGIVGAAYTCEDGYVDPSSCTQAFVQGARRRGGRAIRNVPVKGISKRADGKWEVITDFGTVVSKHVVNAAGMWAPEVGSMLGVYHPIIAIERQYFVTEDIPQEQRAGTRIPVLRDPEGTFYAREEVLGLLIGPYERKPRFFGVDGIPEGISNQSLPDYLDEAEEPLRAAAHRLPILNELGIRSTTNVPTSRTPDAYPLVGPVADTPGYWVAAGFFGGISQSSVCKYLAERLVYGDSLLDLTPFDPRRFGSWATKEYAVKTIKREHVIGLVQGISYPNIEEDAEDWGKSSPLHEEQIAQGAVFAFRSGWKVPVWYCKGRDKNYQAGFEPPKWYDTVRSEVIEGLENVGLYEGLEYGRIELAGADAEELLCSLCATDVPSLGKAGLTTVVTPHGRIGQVFRVVHVSYQRFILISFASQRHILYDEIDKLKAQYNDVRTNDISNKTGMYYIIGKKAQKLVSDVYPHNDEKLNNKYNQVHVLRYFGEEIILFQATFLNQDSWIFIHNLKSHKEIYDQLILEGKKYDLKLIGLKAIESLLLEEGTGEYLHGMPYCGTVFDVSQRKTSKAKAQSFCEACEVYVTQHFCVEGGESYVFGNERIYNKDQLIGLSKHGGRGFSSGFDIVVAEVPEEKSLFQSVRIETCKGARDGTPVSRDLKAGKIGSR